MLNKKIDQIISHISKTIESCNKKYIFLSLDFFFISLLLEINKDINLLVKEVGNFILSEYAGKKNKIILIQAYNLSFPQSLLFDKSASLSIPSAFNSYLLKDGKINRTDNPMYSFFYSSDDGSLGGLNQSRIFGNESVFSSIIDLDTCLITLGQHYVASLTSIHHAEHLGKVKYREEKDFYGKTIDLDGTEYQSHAKFFARKINECSFSGLTNYGDKVILSNPNIAFRHNMDNANGLYGYVVNLKKVNEMLLDDIFSNQKLIGVIKPGGSEKNISTPRYERSVYMEKR